VTPKLDWMLMQSPIPLKSEQWARLVDGVLIRSSGWQAELSGGTDSICN